MNIPLETRAEAAREKIRQLGLESQGLAGFLARVDRALLTPQPEMELRFIEQDIARWAESEKGR